MNTDLLLTILHNKQRQAAEDERKEAQRLNGWDSPDHIRARCKAEVLDEIVDAFTEAL